MNTTGRLAKPLAVLSLAALALTGCGDKDKSAAPAASSAAATTSAAAAPSSAPAAAPTKAGATKAGATASSGTSSGDAKPEGDVPQCTTKQLTFTVEKVAQPAGNALITATNTGATCRVPFSEPVITAGGVTANRVGPEGDEPALETGTSAYARVLLAPGNGATPTKVSSLTIAMTAGESPVTVKIGGGSAQVTEPQVTVFFGSGDAALAS
ncbi:DUF4232 domain-containing protein [Streptomyces sp. NPDC094032]|uniref:DUF4232 domain-containing protein n=1 Tax=Streptomyces sp. NPDC094032 TaxID=3155308 RepID=UPI003323EF10